MNAITWTAARAMVKKDYPRACVKTASNVFVGSGGEDSFGPTTTCFVTAGPDDWTHMGTALCQESAWLEAARSLHLIPDPAEGSYYRKDLIENFGPTAAR